MVRRFSLSIETLLSNLKILIEFGATLECLDSLGHDLIMYAIRHNNE